MYIAVEGCCHGELTQIYQTIANLERSQHIKCDLLLCCGDFQAIRNPADLSTMAVPAKYKQPGDFHKYYSGELIAPILTIFVGGNHESASYLSELPYGGYVAPNIYFLGYSGSVVFRGLRISGISGIFKYRDYLKGHFEYPPFNSDTMRSFYHIRAIDITRLHCLRKSPHIFLSHDWPTGIWNYGDVKQLIKSKPYFQKDIDQNELGCKQLMELLRAIKPHNWCSAHLHCHFEASVLHGKTDNGNSESCAATNFLALNKCGPKRKYVSILDISVPNHYEQNSFSLEFDPEWLAILKLTDDLMRVSASKVNSAIPDINNESFELTLKEVISSFNSFEIPDFKFYNQDVCGFYDNKAKKACEEIYDHPHTSWLAKQLGIKHPSILFEHLRNCGMIDANTSFDNSCSFSDSTFASFNDSTFNESALLEQSSLSSVSLNPNEITLDSDSSTDEEEPAVKRSLRDKSVKGNDNSKPLNDVAVISQLDQFLEKERSPYISNELSTPNSISNDFSHNVPLDASTPLGTKKTIKRRNVHLYSFNDS